MLENFLIFLPLCLFIGLLLFGSFSKVRYAARIRQVLFFARFPRMQWRIASLSTGIMKFYVAMGALIAAAFIISFIALSTQGRCNPAGIICISNQPMTPYLGIPLFLAIWWLCYKLLVKCCKNYLTPPDWMTEPVITYSVSETERPDIAPEPSTALPSKIKLLSVSGND